jgi:pyrimidine operon attenuation protein / uracil phosphoribosyltransferase
LKDLHRQIITFAKLSDYRIDGFKEKDLFMSTAKKYILTEDVAGKKLRRMAYEILENNLEENELILAGINGSGTVVAQTIQKLLAEISTLKTELINLDIDKKNPGEISLSADPCFNDKVIIIIDDVSNSGKTLTYALKPFLRLQPRKIQTLVLVERSHTSFPVRPDYVGLSVATTLEDHIFVEVSGEKVTGAWLQ